MARRPSWALRKVLDVADERRKDVLEIVVVVGGIFARAALGGGEGRELAGKPQQLVEQPLRMNKA